jgi:hypothetical protein
MSPRLPPLQKQIRIAGPPANNEPEDWLMHRTMPGGRVDTESNHLIHFISTQGKPQQFHFAGNNNKIFSTRENDP